MRKLYIGEGKSFLWRRLKWKKWSNTATQPLVKVRVRFATSDVLNDIFLPIALTLFMFPKEQIIKYSY